MFHGKPRNVTITSYEIYPLYRYISYDHEQLEYADNVTKETCTCALAEPADQCKDCQKCAVRSIGDSDNPSKVHTSCADPNGHCCFSNLDCEGALCETCNTSTGFCEGGFPQLLT